MLKKCNSYGRCRKERYRTMRFNDSHEHPTAYFLTLVKNTRAFNTRDVSHGSHKPLHRIFFYAVFTYDGCDVSWKNNVAGLTRKRVVLFDPEMCILNPWNWSCWLRIIFIVEILHSKQWLTYYSSLQFVLRESTDPTAILCFRRFTLQFASQIGRLFHLQFDSRQIIYKSLKLMVNAESSALSSDRDSILRRLFSSSSPSNSFSIIRND